MILAQLTNPLAPNLSPKTEAGGVTIFNGVVGVVINVLFVGGTILFFFFLMMGAIQWIMSGGDKAGIEKARGMVTNPIVGLLVLFSVYAIIKLIEAMFGVNILQIDLGKIKIN